MNDFLKKEKNGVFKLMVWVNPNARENKIEGVRDGFLRVKLKAPPVDGKANKELLEFLSKVFKVKLKDVSILKGERSRKKVVLIKSTNLKNPF